MTEERERKRIRLYSRRGDLGETSLIYGPRVGKDHRRIELSGTLEELSARLGWIRTLDIDPDVVSVLKRLQFRIAEVKGEVLSITPVKFEVRVVLDADVKSVEKAVDQWDSRGDALRRGFVPSGTRTATALYMALTDCRRAERRACALLRFDPDFSPRVGAWLNRVGDLLLALAKYENSRAGIREDLVDDEPNDFNFF